MPYAEVAVNSPAGQRWSFTYSIPPSLNVGIGQAVWVPFGSRTLEGVVVDFTDLPVVEETREIAGIIDGRPVLSPAQVALARWISAYYLSSLFEAVSLMLPPGFKRKSLTFVSAIDHVSEVDASSLTADQRNIMEAVQPGRRVDLRLLEKSLGQRKAQSAVSHLVRRGLLSRTYEVEAPRVKPKVETYVSLASQAGETAMNATKSKKQAALLAYLTAHPHPIAWQAIKENTDCDRPTLNTLSRKGLVTVTDVPITRDPLAARQAVSSQPLALTPSQQSALQAIISGLTREQPSSPAVFLLHGVTGSGKTEVYLQALAQTIKKGKRGIVLVPEISLTPQTIDRFAARFPRKVAVLHSGMSLGEQFDEWQRIRSGEFDVVIGARSALFAPQPDLGIIIIDEEHEWTYKQDDKPPRYHARDVAVRLAGLTGAVVVLGSATPDIESFHRAKHGEYHLLRLPDRVTPGRDHSLPSVQIIDMREELKSGNAGLFSAPLSAAVSTAVAAGEQVVLFLNRRGAATFVQCRNCGLVMRCRRCEVALTHHSDTDTLVCHQCNYHTRVPSYCPQCRSPRIKFLGAGTQKLEEEALRSFAPATVLRWDSDTTAARNAHERISREFREHRADILIGTQMVAKGLDIPDITVVGVVNADTSLNLPDFRSGERTFQLLSQVAGRAGRGPSGGQVIFQTYNPDHYAIQAAAKHDYTSFYDREITYRRHLNYPPFSRLASLVYSHSNEAACRREVARVKELLEGESLRRGIAGFSLIGPAPAFARRLRGLFRWQIIVRAQDPSAFLADIPLPRGWAVDIDPVTMA